jgi:hypothetical protein
LIIIILVVICLVGLALTAVRLPGGWLIVMTALAHGWWTDWQPITVTIAVVLVGLAITGEVLELLMSAVTARKAGASRRAAWGGLIGGIVGMFVLSLPLPIIGTFFGAIAGCFCGAMIGELTAEKTVTASARVGVFSAIGLVLGAIAKLAVAFMLCGVLLTSVVCSSPAVESAIPSILSPDDDRAP